MAFNWKEFFALAQYLKTCNGTGFSTEATLRTAIGRIYFTAYALARDFAVSRHQFVLRRSADDHASLIRHFKARRAAGIGRDLEDLRNKRNACDYDELVEDLQSMFEDAIEVFETFEGKLR